MGEKTTNNRNALRKNKVPESSLTTSLGRFISRPVTRKKDTQELMALWVCVTQYRDTIPSVRRSTAANRSINVIFIAYIFEGWT